MVTSHDSQPQQPLQQTQQVLEEVLRSGPHKALSSHRDTLNNEGMKMVPTGEHSNADLDLEPVKSSATPTMARQGRA